MSTSSACPALAIALLLGSACGGGSGSPDAGPPGDAAIPDPIFEVARGSFRVIEALQLSDEGNYAFGRASGAINHETPASFHTESMREGNCRLLTFDVAECDPYCNGVCVDTNVCVDWPTYASAGTITLQGLKTSLTLRPESGFNWYNPTSYPIPEDLFDPGQAITATAAGAEIPGFTLEARGVETMDLDISGVNITIENGSDFALTWTPGSRGARVRLTLNSPNQGHGLPYRGIIECDGPDTGSLTIPEALIEAFPEVSVVSACVSIDCPPSTFARYTRGAARVDESDIELVVSSEVHFRVVHQASGQ